MLRFCSYSSAYKKKAGKAIMCKSLYKAANFVNLHNSDINKMFSFRVNYKISVFNLSLYYYYFNLAANYTHP